MSVFFDGDHFWLPPLATPVAAPIVCPPVVHTTVAAWARTHLNFHADPVQAEILNTCTHRLAVCCSRQWGKSTVAAIKALHLAWHQPAAFIVFASRSFEQSAELLRHFRLYATRLTGEPCQTEPGRRGALQLPNQSRILALPQSPETVRSLSAPDVIVIDDAAFVSDEMHHALSPMLAVSNGQLWLLSSPNSPAGEFHRVWHAKGDDWRRFSVSADNCARISPAFLERERQAKGEDVFNREYMCQFNAGRQPGIGQNHINDAFRGEYPAVSLPTVTNE